MKIAGIGKYPVKLTTYGDLMRITILTIGSEITSGRISDGNGPYLASKLHGLGFIVNRLTSVADDREKILTEIQRSVDESSVVITSGGLGPTSDDFTREVISEACKKPLKEDGKAREKLSELHKKRGRPLNENSLRQVQFPDGATIITNPTGTADSFISEATSSKGVQVPIVALPGVPREFKHITDEALIPWLQARFQVSVPITKSLRLFGLSEAQIGEAIDNLSLSEEITVSYRPQFPEILVTFHAARGLSDKKAFELVEDAQRKTSEVLGPKIVFTEKEQQTLSQAVGELLLEKKKTVSFAESCTGGMIASRLIDNSGASGYLLSSCVCYANSAKEGILKVPHELLLAHGAVSEEVALFMARSIRELSGSDYAFSTTGVAGPTGGTAEKPVGTLWIGFSKEGVNYAKKYELHHERNMYRSYATTLVYKLLREELLGL